MLELMRTLQKMYNKMKSNNKLRLTMREIIKWMNRQRLFQQTNEEYFTQFPSYPLVLVSFSFNV